MTVEEFEDLDGDLAPVFEAVAELRGAEGPAVRTARLLQADGDHLAHRRAQEEMIRRDLVGPAEPTGKLEQPAHVALHAPARVGQVAHPRRAKPLRAAQSRGEQSPGGFVPGRQPHCVAGQADEGAVQHQFARASQPLQGGDEDPRRQPRLQLQAQVFASEALQVGVLAVKGGEPFDEVRRELAPARG
nr:hypothetical protein [Phenylobacterium sp.]